MQFVLWGAGIRGRFLRKFLGEQAVAFIDNKKSMQGTEKDGLPILSFKEFLSAGEKYKNAWVIITPRSFISDIAGQMEKCGFYRYFVMQRAREDFYEYRLDEILARCMNLADGNKEICFDGLDCFHAVLYEKLKKQGMHPVIAMKGESWKKDAVRRELLTGWDIRREGRDSCVMQDEKILHGLSNLYETPELTKFHNMYRGRRCFVVATGPSLRMEDLEKLRETGELCISMNGIYRAFPKVSWRPDFFFFTDPLMCNYRREIDAMDVPYKIMADDCPEFWQWEHPANVYKMHLFSGHPAEATDCFSVDFAKRCYSNGTVTNCCLQFAVYLGCQEIYLLGCDCYNLVNKKGRNNHFTQDYNENDTNDDLDTFYTDELSQQLMLRGYQAAKKFADAHPPLKIYNATRGGHLEVFERRNFDELFS